MSLKLKSITQMFIQKISDLNFMKEDHPKDMNEILNRTISNFLAFLLDSKNEYTNQLSDMYTEKEKAVFVYNCALNTVDEYIYTRKLCKSISVSSQDIMDLFKTNFRLQQFERYSLNNNNNIRENTKMIINQFDYIKDDLNNEQKNSIQAEINNLVASTT